MVTFENKRSPFDTVHLQGCVCFCINTHLLWMPIAAKVLLKDVRILITSFMKSINVRSMCSPFCNNSYIIGIVIKPDKALILNCFTITF